MSRTSAAFLYEPHAAERHTPIHRLAHVVDAGQGHLHPDQRLHLDPCVCHRLRGDPAIDGVFRGLELQDDVQVTQRNRVAQRYQFGSALGCHDGGNTGDCQNVTLPVSALGDQTKRLRQHLDSTLGDGTAAVLYYIVVYGVTNLAAFAVLSLVRSRGRAAEDLGRLI